MPCEWNNRFDKEGKPIVCPFGKYCRNASSHPPTSAPQRKENQRASENKEENKETCTFSIGGMPVSDSLIVPETLAMLKRLLATNPDMFD
jgi:hypothetical protein